MTLILVGQNEPRDRLALQAFAAIRQRIDLQCKMTTYDRSQTAGYIQKHLSYAGSQLDIFSEAAVDDIYRYANGVARMINKVCTHCLFYGAQNQHRIIDDHMVKRVIEGDLS